MAERLPRPAPSGTGAGREGMVARTRIIAQPANREEFCAMPSTKASRAPCAFSFDGLVFSLWLGLTLVQPEGPDEGASAHSMVKSSSREP